MIDPAQIKKDFPILNREKNGKTLVYLDNASTTQKPKQVIEAITNFYENTNANIHRGIYDISEEATALYEGARETTQKFINAASKSEIIFTRNTTESINLVAYTWGEKNVQKGDEIIVSMIEHHSNLLPWQFLAKKKGAHLKFIPIKDDLTLDIEEYKKLLSEKTKLVAITGMSNVLGTIAPIEEITNLAKEHGAHVLIDAAQTAAHQQIDVQKINCDFLAFSSHKMLGPTGVGVLYARQSILKKMPPFLYGGSMIAAVELDSAEFAKPPQKFEAGTSNIADVVAFKSALDYITDLTFNEIQKHEK
ncbi:aminotransferase class V-fold PLP-dependent enzyme, partial [Candidatus Peregrinibacteria bacterium]|nr:aminotransferase class V-fold PLP-dependent enzyme [Candidatus Peregrinibacteria bacterium]